MFLNQLNENFGTSKNGSVYQTKLVSDILTFVYQFEANISIIQYDSLVEPIRDQSYEIIHVSFTIQLQGRLSLPSGHQILMLQHNINLNDRIFLLDKAIIVWLTFIFRIKLMLLTFASIFPLHNSLYLSIPML